MEYYRRAEDLKSVVRMLNQTERGDEALELVRSSKNEAAAFQLAHMRETEEDADPELLVDLYNMARAYSSAIRICIVGLLWMAADTMLFLTSRNTDFQGKFSSLAEEKFSYVNSFECTKLWYI